MPFSSFNFKPQRTQTSPFSSFFSVKTCTAPHTRTCNFSDPGGLVAHEFQLFKQETPYQIDYRYFCPSPVSMLNPNGPKLHHFRHFFRLEPALPHTHTHARVTFRTLEVWLLTGFNFLNKRQETTQPIDSRYLCPSLVSMLNLSGLTFRSLSRLFSARNY